MDKKIILIIIVILAILTALIVGVFINSNKVGEGKKIGTSASGTLSKDLAAKYKNYSIIEARYVETDLAKDIPFPKAIILNGSIELSTEYLQTEPLAKVLSRLTSSECNFKLTYYSNDERLNVGSFLNPEELEDKYYSEQFFQDLINNNKELLLYFYDRINLKYQLSVNYYEESTFLEIDARGDFDKDGKIGNKYPILLVYEDNKSLEIPNDMIGTPVFRIYTYPSQAK